MRLQPRNDARAEVCGCRSSRGLKGLNFITTTNKDGFYNKRISSLILNICIFKKSSSDLMLAWIYVEIYSY